MRRIYAMNKNEMTVTMPLKEYEALQSILSSLQKDSVFNFVKQEFTERPEDAEYNVIIDVDAIKDFVRENKPYAKDVVVLQK
jgi:hypothetical protein